MKNIFVVSAMASMLLAPMIVNAATTTELKVIGTITPAACAPNFVGGSTIDYGKIPVGTLNVSENTSLPLKYTTLTVSCDSPVKFAFKFADERESSVSEQDAQYTRYGLGVASDGANIGFYKIGANGITSEDGDVTRIRSNNAGSSWASSVSTAALTTSHMYGFSSDGSSLVPSAFQNIALKLRVFAWIAPSNTLPVSDEIQIDGLSTVEVVYL